MLTGMDLATFKELLSAAGQVALAEAARLDPTEAGFLAAYDRLRKRFPPELAKAALETILLRVKARPRHSRADRLYFTREALEQSSSGVVARYRAQRFAKFATVLDLCCGVGMDAIALAEANRTVHAIDSDPLKLAMAEANAAAAGVADRIRFHLGDVLALPLPAADAAFADPSRRTGDRRHLDPEQYQPSLSALRARFPAAFPLGVKIAPGVARRDFDLLPAEAEFISLGGELKECALWFGELKTCHRRATILGNENVSLTDLDEASDSGRSRDRLEETLYDPDSSVIRADLLDGLALQLEAEPLEHGIAMLVGPGPIPTPFATAYRIEARLPFKPEAIREFLKPLGVGRVTILTRAVEVDVNALAKKLKLAGSGHRHLILTRAGGKAVAIVATIAE